MRGLSIMDIKYSIVATVYNDEREVEYFLSNLLNQTYAPEEIIITDGGSTDKTIDIIKKIILKNKKLIKLYYGKRMGFSRGLNHSISRATTDYIAIAATGNKYNNDFYEKLLEGICKQKLDIVYGTIIGEAKTTFQELYSKTFITNLDKDGLKIISNHGMIVNKKVFEHSGYFYEGFLHCGEDAEWPMRISNIRYKIGCIPQAKLIWETPKNLKEYNAQVEGYLIAWLQIYSAKILFSKLWLGFLRIILCMAGIVFSIKKSTRKTGKLLLFCKILDDSFDCTKNGIRQTLLNRYTELVRIFLLFKDIKYLFPKNRVNFKKNPIFLDKMRDKDIKIFCDGL